MGRLRRVNVSETTSIEIDLVLDAIRRRWGYDFRTFAPAAIERRLRHIQTLEGCETLSAMIPRLLHERAFFARVAQSFAAEPADMFATPDVFAALRRLVAPYLRTLGEISIWLPGCGSGEEAYSLAILLDEAGVLARSTIYATDVADAALAQAREGIYPLNRLPAFVHNYRAAGGAAALTDYCQMSGNGVRMQAALRDRITFAHHDLAVDQPFAMTHLIVCRQALADLDGPYRDRALGLFAEGLEPGGFLCVGKRDSLATDNGTFSAFDPTHRLFRKAIPAAVTDSRTDRSASRSIARRPSASDAPVAVPAVETRQ